MTSGRACKARFYLVEVLLCHPRIVAPLHLRNVLKLLDRARQESSSLQQLCQSEAVRCSFT